MYNPRQWLFVADMNFSGAITIKDVWLWVKWLYFYPGDVFIYFLLNKVPGVGHFFEMTYSSYGGVLSGILSFFIWIIIALVIISAILSISTQDPKSVWLKPSIPINMTPSQAADPNFKRKLSVRKQKALEKLYYANLDPDSAKFKAYWGKTNQKLEKQKNRKKG